MTKHILFIVWHWLLAGSATIRRCAAGRGTTARSYRNCWYARWGSALNFRMLFRETGREGGSVYLHRNIEIAIRST